MEREALAQFWTSPGHPVWHPVPGEGGQLLWTRLPAMAGEAVLLTRRDGSVIGTAAAPAERIAFSSALEEFTAMASGGARLRPADAQRLRALMGRGRRKAASTRECRPSPLPRHLRTRVATPVGLPISLAVCRSLPEARLRLPQWDV